MSPPPEKSSKKRPRSKKDRTSPAQEAPARESTPSKEALAPVTWPMIQRGLVAGLVAWIVPGAGHVLLKRRGRGAIFFVLVALALIIGCSLDGDLPWHWSGSPLRVLATLGAMGSGAAFFVLRYGVGYEGDILAAGFEYGRAFIITAGLMNLLLVLDAWDISLGRKE